MAETPDGTQIFETLNQCQQPPISRSLVMQDTVSQVFYYLKLRAFLIIPKDGGHTLDSNEFHHDFSLAIYSFKMRVTIIIHFPQIKMLQDVAEM